MNNKHKKRTFKSKKGSRKIRRATQKGGMMRSVVSTVKTMVVHGVARDKLIKQQILRNALYLTALCRLVQVPRLFECFYGYKTEYVDVFTPKDRTLSSSERDVLQPLVERQSEKLNKLLRYLDEKHITDDLPFRTRMARINEKILPGDRPDGTGATTNDSLRIALVDYMKELITPRRNNPESQIIRFNKYLVSANWRANSSHSESTPPDLSNYIVRELPQEFSDIIDEWDASAPPRPTDTARGDPAGPTTPLLAVNKQ